MNFRESISKQVETSRPNIAVKTNNTYTSLLHSLSRKVSPDNESVNWFSTDKENILKHLENIPNNSRKTMLSALYVITGEKQYQEDMLKLCKVVNNEYKTQMKTEKQTQNWISPNAIYSRYEYYRDVLKKDGYGNHSAVIRFLLLALLGGCIDDFVPRRSMDYSLMKIKGYNTKTDNYYKAGKFYFNQYKTASTYGLQVIPVPKSLNTIIRKWIKHNPTDYLLFGKTQKPLSSSQITKILNKIFDKNISVDMLRHIYLSNMYKDMPELTTMEETASNMGHSIQTALQYVKK